ncbi:rhodanese-like domain-containing protein [Acidimangrovimonas sediminis]|uniref:rhodanese-like domain-containing protein n=1 Tax=Acidimangrovimonas sediminis TaxID=2056283 RepID=UPI000C8011C9|nr:rhodanese-like domain-containing protein [Acidimangrovimonas sediminis]
MTDQTLPPKSAVAEVPAASAEEALAHFSRRLSFETDCDDTHGALRSGRVDFVLLDVRAPDRYARGHVPGAINLPRGKMTERRMSQWPDDTLFVVYCAGPHCNGANKAAVVLARQGRPVKEMIGGITGWLDEGFALTEGSEPGGFDQEAPQDAPQTASQGAV